MGAVTDVLRAAGSRPLLVAVGAVAVGVVVAAVLGTPWRPLDVAPDLVVPSEPTRDFSPVEIEAADAFHAAVRPPALLALGTGLAATALVGLTPLGARLVRSLPSPRWAPVLVPAVAGGLLVLLGVRLLTLPLAAWQESVRRDAGLSTRDWAGWALDVGRGFALSTVLSVAAVVAVVLLASRWPRRWWAVAAPGAATLVVVASLAYPLVVEPVFNRFEPLPDGPLRADLLRLAEAEGVAVGDVLVADASRRTTTLNAYVSGLGPTKRVVLYDTLLETAPPAQIELVVAHELAHARENDVLRGTLVGAGGAALAVLLLAATAAWTPLPRLAGLGSAGADRSPLGSRHPGRSPFGSAHAGRSPLGSAGAGQSPLGQAAAVPFVLAVLAVLGFAAGPVEALLSRQVEARADVVALDLTGDPDTFVAMQRTLALAALSDVDPPRLLHLWFASHPTAPERIALARTWSAAKPQ